MMESGEIKYVKKNKLAFLMPVITPQDKIMSFFTVFTIVEFT